jgi:predicted phosphohydrolase
MAFSPSKEEDEKKERKKEGKRIKRYCGMIRKYEEIVVRLHLPPIRRNFLASLFLYVDHSKTKLITVRSAVKRP